MASKVQGGELLDPEKLKPWPRPAIPTFDPLYGLPPNTGPIERGFLGMFSMHEKVVTAVRGPGHLSDKDPHMNARETLFAFARAIDQGITRSDIVCDDGTQMLFINTITYKGEKVWHIPKEGGDAQDPVIFVRCAHFDHRNPICPPEQFIQAVLQSANGNSPIHQPSCNTQEVMKILNEIFRTNSAWMTKKMKEELEAEADPRLLKIPNSYYSFMTPVMIPVANDSVQACKVCGTDTTRTCARCMTARYCSDECQRLDWREHKRSCKTPEEVAQIPVPHQAQACKVCGMETTRKCSRCKHAHYCSKGCQRSGWREHKRSCKSPEDSAQMPVPKDPVQACKVCGTGTNRKCSRCKTAHYCSEGCQRTDWREHKHSCKTPGDAAQAAAASGVAEGGESDEPWVDIDPRKTPLQKDDGMVHVSWSRISSTGSMEASFKPLDSSLDEQPKNKVMIVKVQIMPGSSAREFKEMWIYPQGKKFWIKAEPRNFPGTHYDYTRLHTLVRKRGFDIDLGYEGCKAYLNAYVRDDGVLRVMMDTLHPMQKW